MQSSIVLYHYWRSSCSWRVRWVLALKQISYQSVAINLLDNEQRSPAYLTKNPSGLVPCLEWEGKVLSESPAIIEWIEETFPQAPILPRDPWLRAETREIASMIATGIQPLQNLKVQRHYSQDAKAREEWSRFFIQTGLEVLEARLKRGSGLFCLSDNVSLADIYLIPQIYNAMRVHIAMEEYPRLDAIYRHCMTTTECLKAAPHNQPGATSV